MAILFISHHLGEVFAECDRVVVIKDGRKVHESAGRRYDAGSRRAGDGRAGDHRHGVGERAPTARRRPSCATP